MTRLAFLCLLMSLTSAAYTQGFGDITRGGQDGRIIKVTNLHARGPGSLAEAIASKGRRMIVFEVAGVIDLNGKMLRIKEPYLTVAGQTAPSPGITLIKGGVSISTHDVILQHLRVRPGSAGRKRKSGWEADGITLSAASRVVIDHCSVSWATDENLSASGPRFEGENVAEWREHTSHDVTISNCLIAQGLANSTHGKGEHSKGSLIHDNATRIAIVKNLYVSNVERNPMLKGGVQAVIVNNWISNPQRRAMHHILSEREWKGEKPIPSELAVVGNVMEYGRDTQLGTPFFYNHNSSPLKWYQRDNLAYDRHNKTVPLLEGHVSETLSHPPLWPKRLVPLPADQVRSHVATNVGARPWDRDPIDERIIQEAVRRSNRVIDHEDQAGGYPEVKPVHRSFNPAD